MDADHGLDWLYDTGGVEETGYAAFYEQMDVTLMGRRTFHALEQAGTQACPYPTTENYVFTHRALSRPGFQAVSGDVVEFAQGLGRDKNIWVVGGNTVLAPRLDVNRVDRLILQIAPVLLGRGIPLFTQGEDLKRFSLEAVRKYGPFAELEYWKKEG